MCRRRRRALGLALALAACEQGRLRDQPRLDPLESSIFFVDGAAAQPAPDGAVPRGQARLDRHLWEGRGPDGALVTTYPFAITADDLRRGEQRFAIHCVPCHGRLGEGDGVAVRRGYPAPSSYDAPRVRAETPGDIFDVITHGRAYMPDYDHISVADRWRIVAWVQVLQQSLRTPVSALSPEERARLEEARR